MGCKGILLQQSESHILLKGTIAFDLQFFCAHHYSRVMAREEQVAAMQARKKEVRDTAKESSNVAKGNQRNAAEHHEQALRTLMLWKEELSFIET